MLQPNVGLLEELSGADAVASCGPHSHSLQRRHVVREPRPSRAEQLPPLVIDDANLSAQLREPEVRVIDPE